MKFDNPSPTAETTVTHVPGSKCHPCSGFTEWKDNNSKKRTRAMVRPVRAVHAWNVEAEMEGGGIREVRRNTGPAHRRRNDCSVQTDNSSRFSACVAT